MADCKRERGGGVRGWGGGGGGHGEKKKRKGISTFLVSGLGK